jgi:hypothetical protein
VSPFPIEETTPPVTRTNLVRRFTVAITEDSRITPSSDLHAKTRRESPPETNLPLNPRAPRQLKFAAHADAQQSAGADERRRAHRRAPLVA